MKNEKIEEIVKFIMDKAIGIDDYQWGQEQFEKDVREKINNLYEQAQKELLDEILNIHEKNIEIDEEYQYAYRNILDFISSKY